MAEEKSFVIVFILVLIVIVVVLLAATGWFSQIYAGIRGTSLDPETKEKMEDNFDSFVKKIEDCSTIKDYQCFCDVMPNFPGSFVKELNLKFYTKGKMLKIELTQKDKKIRESEINNFNLQVMSLTTNLFMEERTFYQVILEFTKKFPFVKNIKEFVVSEKIYKKSNEDAFFLTTKKQENVETINEEIKVFPQCINNRIEAIKEFNNLAAVLLANETQENYKISLPENYTIECKKNEMFLMYNNEKVKEIELRIVENKKIEKVLETKFVKFAKSNILCEKEQMTIKPNQEIEIKNGCIA